MLTGPFQPFLDHRSLLWEMTKRDVLGRYRGASFGLLWALLSPFLMLCVYTVAFGFVLKSRWPHAEDTKASFALILYIGLIVHGFFAECLVRAPQLVLSNPNFVKRVIFPLDVLPVSMVLSATFHALINIVVFAILHAITAGPPPWTIVFFPLVMLPLIVLAAGVAWFLASLGVYLRDVNQVMGVVATALLFLSSAIVPVDALPQKFHTLFELNPLTFIIDQARDVALWGVLPDWAGLGLYGLVAVGVLYCGSLWFGATRGGFADVL